MFIPKLAALYLLLWPRTGTASMRTKPSILDMHCHTAGIGAGGSGCFVSPRLEHSWKFGIYLKSFGVTRKDLAIKKGDALVIDSISAQIAQSRYVGSAVI